MIPDRKKFTWKVQLQNGRTGATEEVTFSSYWSPKWEGVKEAVQEAAAAIAWYKSGKKPDQRTPYVGVSCILQDG